PALSYYYLALRGMGLITLRYVLPVLAIGVIVIALLLIDLWEGARTRTAQRVVAALIGVVAAIALARSLELDYLLRTDARYAAESWIAQHVPGSARGESYQKPVYLPRFTEHPAVQLIAMPERSVSGLQQRQPDFVIVSSKSRKSITHIWNPDWHSTGTLLLP